MSKGAQAEDVVSFWRDAGYQKWFSKDDVFDAEFKQSFETAHWAAARRELEHWMDSAEGALALILLLDQFPRNCFRGSAHSYATDGLARQCAGRAIAAGFDTQVEPALRAFFYLPYEHSEAPADQRRSLELFTLGGPDYLRYAQEHADIIARFGRFPHRNQALGRESTQEEIDYLARGGFNG